MEKKGAPDYQHSTIIGQLCDAVVSKLTERMNQHLTFNQGAVGSNPTRLISFKKPLAAPDS